MDDTRDGIETVVFDVGGVLLDCDPRYLYRRMFSDEAAMERFIEEIDLYRWHEREHDLGRPMEETIPEMCRRFPQYTAELVAWRDRYMESVGSVIDGTVDVLAELRGRVRLFALSNWPADTADELRRGYEFFDWFDGVVISGEERLAKPDPALYELLCDRHQIVPANSVFIDDVDRNVLAARHLGFHAVQFVSSDQLRLELTHHRLLGS